MAVIVARLRSLARSTVRSVGVERRNTEEQIAVRAVAPVGLQKACIDRGTEQISRRQAQVVRSVFKIHPNISVFRYWQQRASIGAHEVNWFFERLDSPVHHSRPRNRNREV